MQVRETKNLKFTRPKPPIDIRPVGGPFDGGLYPVTICDRVVLYPNDEVYMTVKNITPKIAGLFVSIPPDESAGTHRSARIIIDFVNRPVNNTESLGQSAFGSAAPIQKNKPISMAANGLNSVPTDS